MSKFFVLFYFFASTHAFAADCGTIEKAREFLAVYTSAHGYPFGGQMLADDFAELESIETSNEVFCYSGFDDCVTPQIDFGMNFSFEPGARGWVGISKRCEVEYAITFRD